MIVSLFRGSTKFSLGKLTRPSRQWLFLILTVGIAVAVALSMTFAADADAKKKGHKKHRTQSSLAVPTPTPTPSPSPEPQPPPSPPPPQPPPSPPPPQQQAYTTSPIAHVMAVQGNNVPDITTMEGWLTIHKPNFDPDPPSLSSGVWNGTHHHSIGQVALINRQATASQPVAAIEIGWLVAPTKYWLLGDPNYRDPHLFVGVRGANWTMCEITGDNQCGFHATPNPNNQYNILKPGDNLKYKIVNGVPQDRGLVDNDPIRVTIEYHQADSTYNNGWYIWFANFYIGYIDPNWFKSNGQGPAFTAGKSALWFGEVASSDPNDVSCVPMGNGTYGSQVGSARIEGMAINRQPANPAIDIAPGMEQYWNGRIVGDVLYYGGPGRCS